MLIRSKDRTDDQTQSSKHWESNFFSGDGRGIDDQMPGGETDGARLF